MREKAEKTPEQLAAEARRWIASKKGQNALKKALEKKEKFIQEMRECRQIDSDTLQEVFTI